MRIPPSDGLSYTERVVVKFLARYKIGKRTYDLAPKIGDILERALGGQRHAIEKLKFSPNPRSAYPARILRKALDGNQAKDPH